MENYKYVLTFSCPDTKGLVAAVAGFLSDLGGNIVDSAQYQDPSSQIFFMRSEFTMENSTPSLKELRQAFTTLAQTYSMQWEIYSLAYRPKVMILASKAAHCLNQLIYQTETKFLPIEIVAIVSNHEDFEALSLWHKIPFYFLPVHPNKKKEQENQLQALIRELRVDLVVLARYMQILSDDLCRFLYGKAINIHHSFLPSFKGAKPYHQAQQMGVKLIGATAHYVTSVLDEGPIIEQETMRVSHRHSPDDLVSLGRDIESLVLTRAVKFHVEKRVLINGNKTVVF